MDLSTRRHSYSPTVTAAIGVTILLWSSSYPPTPWPCWTGTLFMLAFFSPPLARELPAAPIAITAVVVYLGLFPAALGYTLWAYALSKAPAANVASFMYLTPVLTIGISWLWIRELPSPWSVLGGFVALAGVYLTNTKGQS